MTTPIVTSDDVSGLTPGELVFVRSRQYLVEDVELGATTDQDTLVRLSCLEDDAQGNKLEVLWEREVDARVIGSSAWDTLARKGFDEPKLFSAYLHTLRWNCVTSTDAELFQAPYRAGIDVKAYQLEPLRMALRMPRVRMFIADDVGLGKTIEAGLILREMIMRQKVRRVVVICPPSVVLQWREEMEQRFGLGFVVFDRKFMAQKRRERGYSVNPWTTHTRFILSQSLVRDEHYAGALRDWLGDFASGSLLILDEAHNAAPASGSKYAVDSKLTRAMRALARRFEHKLFLSATPHNGHSNSFSALLEILDPQRFCRGVKVEQKHLDQVMVRRLKADLRAVDGGFPERKIIPVVIDGLPDDAPELRLSHLLQQYRQARAQRLADASKSARNAAMLVLTSLQKRLLSSIEAFARTLAVHKRSMDKKGAPSDRNILCRPEGPQASSPVRSGAELGVALDNLPNAQSGGMGNLRASALLLEAPGADDDRAELPEAEVEAEEDAQMAAATAHASEVSPLESELKLLEEMTHIAEGARHRPDTRMERLIDWVKDNLCPDLGTDGAAWLPRRVLIFTEYTDTRRYLIQQLGAAIEGSDNANSRIGSFHGGMGDESREAIKAAFNADPDRHPLRILIATDAAREGVNLQNHCADLFHFDIPWNPSRMEQRNGRIDRKLQRAPVVRCHYFVLPQRAEDRVLEVAMNKTTIIRQELGSLSPVLERNLDRLLKHGIEHGRAGELVTAIDQLEQLDAVARAAIEEELEAGRKRSADLTDQLTGLRAILDKSQAWLGLSDKLFRDAISASLGLLGAEPLAPLDAAAAIDDEARARWVIPALDQRHGADPTWTTTLDTLRAPRKPKQKPWDWRREAPIRPIVFRDPGTLDGDVVHLHLEHRVAQRLLGRFLAQGFLHDELSRACVCLTDHAVPLVVALGRLSLYGEGAARLHDTVVAVAAEWRDPQSRKSRLMPLGKAELQDALALVEVSLGTERLRASGKDLQTRLKTRARDDVADLKPHLEKAAAQLEKAAKRDLARRANAEAKAMAAILADQRKRIEKEVAKITKDQADDQLALFPAPERKQRLADKKHLENRLARLDEEMENEPDRIRESYVVKAVRIEPAGIVYLWPASG